MERAQPKSHIAFIVKRTEGLYMISIVFIVQMDDLNNAQ